jgi:hypothetical protein
MGEQANRRPARGAMSLIVVLVIALNLALVWLTITG